MPSYHVINQDLANRIDIAISSATIGAGVAGSITASSLATKIANAVTASTLATKIANAITASTLATKIANAVTASTLATKIANAITASTLAANIRAQLTATMPTLIAQKITGSGLAQQIADKITGSGLAQLIANKITASSLASLFAAALRPAAVVIKLTALNGLYNTATTNRNSQVISGNKVSRVGLLYNITAVTNVGTPTFNIQVATSTASTLFFTHKGEGGNTTPGSFADAGGSAQKFVWLNILAPAIRIRITGGATTKAWKLSNTALITQQLP